MERTKKKALEGLRDLSIDVAHPLRIYLVQRGVKLEDAARMFGWSLRKLKDVLGKDHYPRDEDLSEIARALGFAKAEDIFPTHDEHGEPIGVHAHNARRARGLDAARLTRAASSTKKKQEK